MSSTRRKWAWRIAPLALALLAVGGYGLFARAGGAARPASPAAPPRPTPVVLAPVRTRDVGVYITGLGAVTPLNTVTVHTRVDGQLLSVKFREGQLVGEGDLLAEIDSKPFEAQLTQYQGQLDSRSGPAGQRAPRSHALRDAGEDRCHSRATARYPALARPPGRGRGGERSRPARSIQVQLAYCRITSPITGRAGLRQVDPGNIVHAADANGLVVITQLQPIAVIFTIPEDSIPRCSRASRAARPVPVDAYDREQRRKLAERHAADDDNQVGPHHRYGQAEGTFPEHGRRALPRASSSTRGCCSTSSARPPWSPPWRSSAAPAAPSST